MKRLQNTAVGILNRAQLDLRIVFFQHHLRFFHVGFSFYLLLLWLLILWLPPQWLLPLKLTASHHPDSACRPYILQLFAASSPVCLAAYPYDYRLLPSFLSDASQRHMYVTLPYVPDPVLACLRCLHPNEQGVPVLVSLFDAGKTLHT